MYDGSRKPQPYLLNKKFDNEMSSLLFNLRCKTVNSFTDNFHTWYGKEPPCRLCKKYFDSQEHALVCDVIVKELTENQNQILKRTKYSEIFGNVEEQESITKMYQIILSIRDKILSTPQGLPGLDNSGPD